MNPSLFGPLGLVDNSEIKTLGISIRTEGDPLHFPWFSTIGKEIGQEMGDAKLVENLLKKEDSKTCKTVEEQMMIIAFYLKIASRNIMRKNGLQNQGSDPSNVLV